MKVFLLVIGLFHSVAFANNVWQKSTQGSIEAHFEDLDSGAKEICVAIKPTPGLREKLSAKNQTTPDTADRRKADKAYRHKVAEQKVLCMSRYNNGREKKIEMFSYFDGKRAYRVHCQVENGDFVCHNRSKQKRYYPTKHIVLAGGGDLSQKITELKFRQSTNDGKLFRLKPNYLSHRQRVFYPWASKEQDEYKKVDGSNDWEKVFKNIKNVDNGKVLLPICQIENDAITEDSFEERVICHNLFKGKKNYCQSGETNQKINVCKSEGKGIMIEQDDDSILRVDRCEYQPAAMHFYCSGKLQGESTPKVYFERYGIQLVKDITPCPPSRTREAHIATQLCHNQLINKTCDSFAGSIKDRCNGEVRDEGCNFYRNEEEGQKCPDVAELLRGLGCHPTSRHNDPCDFRAPPDSSGYVPPSPVTDTTTEDPVVAPPPPVAPPVEQPVEPPVAPPVVAPPPPVVEPPVITVPPPDLTEPDDPVDDNRPADDDGEAVDIL